MAIIEPVTDESELAQGDIIALPSGGVAFNAQFAVELMEDTRRGLVLSRDCAGVHGESIVLAEIVATVLDAPPVKDETADKRFERLLAVLTNIRDGGTAPDKFYLGSFPGDSKRYFARFDRICSVRPPTAADGRATWVSDNRKFRLTADFRRSLPTRIYWALCRTGFDDCAWFCDDDRKLLLSAGESLIADAESALRKAQTDLALAETGSAGNEKELKGRRAEVERLQERLAQAKQKIEPYGRS